MNNIATQIKGRAVAIESSKAKLTNGQLALLALMKRKIKGNEVITREDIKKLWWDHVRINDHRHSYWDGKIEIYEWSDWSITINANQWFKNNLGSLILKAKLIAIPVIDLD